MLEGSVRAGFNGITGELRPASSLEIRILLPDHYVRIHNNGASIRRTGFAGSVAINDVQAVRRDVVAITDLPTGSDMAAAIRFRAACLLLGMLAHHGGVLGPSASFQAVGEHAVTLTDSESRAAFLDFDETGIPAAVRFQTSVRFPRVIPPEQRNGVPPPAPLERVEMRMAFGDRRDVDGLLLPHEIVMSARSVVFEEIRLTRITVNPRLEPADFTVTPR